MKQKIVRLFTLFFYGCIVGVALLLLIGLFFFLLIGELGAEYYIGKLTNVSFIIKLPVIIFLGYLFELYLKKRLISKRR